MAHMTNKQNVLFTHMDPQRDTYSYLYIYIYIYYIIFFKILDKHEVIRLKLKIRE